MTEERTWALRANVVRTQDSQRPRVESLGVRGGTIVAAGSRDEVASVVGPNAEWLDLRHATVVPGFTDSHIHLIEWALGRKKPDLSDAGTMAAALARIQRAAEAARPGGWIEFRGWNPVWSGECTLSDLDAAAAGHPVALVAHDLHSAWLSSEAMRRVAIEPGRPDPPGGEFERGADGRLTGILKERALDLWYSGRPQPDVVDRKQALKEGQMALLRLGVTAVHSVEGPYSFGIVQDLAHADELRLRVLHHYPQRFLQHLIDCGVRSGLGGPLLKIGGIKIFTDGALGSRTAWMLEPYEGSHDRGIRRLDPEELQADVARAAAAGLSSTIHAIGDAAVRMTLDALEAAPAGALRIPHRIEHLQCVSPEDLSRAARAGIVASMQPSHLLTDVPLIEAAWGEKRAEGTYAFRDLLKVGTVLAFGSDAPVEEADPREGFYAAVARANRKGKPEGGWRAEQKLTGQEVLDGYTLAPALAAGDERWRGKLARGFAADFAAWDTDLASADPAEMLTAKVLMTVIDGERVYVA